MRNKGKVHPSSDEPLSVLTLLPAAILTLTCLLSVEDKQVLAYMITRSMKSTTNASAQQKTHHKPPLFHCDCFDCYTIFWFRWDSSPNRDLIHRAIEAFEEHLNSGDYQKKKNRKKEKVGRRGLDSPARSLPQIQASSPENSEPPAPEPGKCEATLVEDDVVGVPLRETTPYAGRVAVPLLETTPYAGCVAVPLRETTSYAGRIAAANNHKGFARKVLPDVLGVFNSRLWNLWSPNL